MNRKREYKKMDGCKMGMVGVQLGEQIFRVAMKLIQIIHPNQRLQKPRGNIHQKIGGITTANNISEFAMI
jgi:hypothetical protein